MGDSVMYWRPGSEVESGSWHGPGRVLMVEAPNIVWISHMTRLFRFAPEHVRHVSSRELDRANPNQITPSNINSGVFRYRDLAQHEIPEAVIPPTDSNGHQLPPVMPIPASSSQEQGHQPGSADSSQPDDEPVVEDPSVSGSQSEPTPDPVNVPIPTSDDSEGDDAELTVQHHTQDFWQVKGNQLIRHHVNPR